MLGPQTSIEMIAAINIPVCLAGSLQGVGMDDGPRKALPSRALSYSHLPVSGLPDGVPRLELGHAGAGSIRFSVWCRKPPHDQFLRLKGLCLVP